MLTQRRALLQYMRRHEFDTYAVTLSRLDLKDNFAKQVWCHGVILFLAALLAFKKHST